MVNSKRKASFIDIVSLFIVIISVNSIVSLVFNVFEPFVVLIVSFVMGLSLLYFTGITLQRSTVPILLILLLIFSFFLRIQSNPYIMGGQDEGSYINMAAYFKNHGRIFIEDEFRQSLPENIKKIYDRNLDVFPENHDLYKDNQREGNVLPAIYLKNLEKSEYVFQFYHLHPLWMALFSFVLGNDYYFFSLVFFALLSITFFYLIIEKLTKSKKYALFGALLLSIHPLHVYFSQFPVTEVMALTFILGALYYFIVYYKTEETNQYFKYLPLFLSSSFLGCYFFTRISGFMFIPFFVVLAFYILSTSSLEKKVKKVFLIYIGSILLIFIISVIYGLIFSFPYAYDIYVSSFRRVLGHRWIMKLLSLGFFIIFVFIFTSFSNKMKLFFQRVFKYIIKYSYVLFLIVLLLGLYRIGKHLFYNNLEVGMDRWNIVGSGFGGIKRTSLFSLISYLNPVISIIMVLSIFTYNKKNPINNILVLAIFNFFSYVILLQYIIPYQYYYARYLFSELIPLILLFISIQMSEIKKRKFGEFLIYGFSIIYFLFLLLPQLKYTDSDFLNEDLSSIMKLVPENEILVVNNPKLRYFDLETPLKYYYDKDIINVTNTSIIETLSTFKYEGWNDFYFFTTTKFVDENFKLLSEKELQLLSSNITDNFTFKVEYQLFRNKFYLYHVDLQNLNVQKFSNYIWGELQGNNAIIHNMVDQTWTSSEVIIDNIDSLIMNDYLVIETNGWNPYKNDYEKIGLRIFIDELEVPFIEKKGNLFYFDVGMLDHINTLKIKCNTFVPAEIGTNVNDNRNLGIDLKSIMIVEKIK